MNSVTKKTNLMKKMRKKRKEKAVVASIVPGIEDKGMNTLKHNTNLHRWRFKNDQDFKIDQKEKFRLIYLLDKLKDEEKVGKKMSHVVDANWRDKLRKSKLSSLKVEFVEAVEFKSVELNCQHERMVKLEGELNECNDVFGHMEKNVSFEFKERVVENFKGIIEVLKRNYIRQVELIKNQFDDEAVALKEAHRQRLDQIQCYVNVIEAGFLNELKHLDAHFKQLKDEETTNHKNEMISLKLNYEKQADSLKSTLKALMDEYEKEQKQSLRRYIELSKVVQKTDEALMKDKLHYDNLLAQHANLKTHCVYVDVLGYRKDNVKELKKQREEKLNDLSQNQSQIRKHLRILSRNTHEALEALKTKHLKAKKIVKLIKSCSKLEFFDEVDITTAQHYEDLSCTPFIEIFTEHGYLANLYQKYNYAQLNVKAVLLERNKLHTENEYLKATLRNYLNSLNKNNKNFL